MRRLLLVVAVLGLAFSAAREVEAGTDVSIDFFYDNLGSDGNWVELADYGYCWQPAVSVSNQSWRPYTDGYWAYTDVGWTWVSYEDFGWATYHYGRWIRLRGRGWVWVPGRDWGPAWVSWRTGGDYVGWAPLPPRAGGDLFYDFSPITPQVDVQLDIGPAYYNFIDIRYIGEPVLRERIFAPEQNVTYITSTVNVTNIAAINSTIYNQGPDYNTLSRYSTRPIQRLSLERDPNADPLAAVRSKSLMKVEGDKLVVAAPQQFQKPSKPVAPKVVKEKLTQAPVERGWEPVGDPKAQAELKQKMQAEDPKTVTAPSMKPREDAAQNPIALSQETAPSSPAAPAPNLLPKRDATSEDRERITRPVTPSPAVSSEDAQPGPPPERDKGAKKEKPVRQAPDDRPVNPPQPNDAVIHKQKPQAEPTPAPPNRDDAADAPPSRTIPPKREQLKRVAPPTEPGRNAPAKPDGPRKGPDKKESAPSPPQG